MFYLCSLLLVPFVMLGLWPVIALLLRLALLPLLPAIARLTNLENGRQVTVRLNDRGSGDPPANARPQSATWFDVDVHARIMWRTTVSGNPGKLYAGERKSWIPQAAE